MIGIVIILATVILGQTGLAVFLAVSAHSAWGKAGDARELAAQRTGEAALSAERVSEANQATKTALDAEHAQEKRGDSLEADASKPGPAGSGLERLSNDMSATADPAASSGSGGSGAAPLPDRPAR